MKQIDHKIIGGKFLRLQVEIENELIKKIMINGDFFIHPEAAVLEIEEILTEKNINEVEKILLRFLKEEKIQVIGFTPKDLQEALLQNYKN